MESANEPTQFPASTQSTPDELPRRAFNRVNTYVPDDLNDKLRNVGARIRKSVTEGYATNRWNGEQIAPNAPRTRAQLGLGRPSIFQSGSGEGMRRIYTTPAQTLAPPTGGLQRFADFGEPPARPTPGSSMRVRAASMGAQRPADTTATTGRKASAKLVPDGFDSPSDSESDGDKSPNDQDTLGEMFEFGEDERSAGMGSHMFGSGARPSNVLAASEGTTRVFQQTQSLPAGSLEFAVRQSHTTPLEPLGEDEPWRKHDFSKSAAAPPE
ncbi:ribonucleotide reductase inhibitor protein [Ceratobasidium sp. AG-Ba]|nr:ribonucleotide reductase inhibitor protein [Ceratobasidium sp. AG-Ba]